jgi:hypothetical protein
MNYLVDCSGQFSKCTAWESCPVISKLWRRMCIVITLPIVTAAAALPNENRLTGVWEAIVPYGERLVHIELISDKVGWMALAFFPENGGGKPQVFKLSDSALTGNNVKLVFSPQIPSLENVVITGRIRNGVLLDHRIIEGELAIGHFPRDRDHRMKLKIYLRQGTWTRRFDQLSKSAEEAIRAARIPTTEG